MSLPALFRFIVVTVNLLFPTACAGCGQWDCVLCDRCASRALEIPRCCAIEGVGGGERELPLWFLGPYEGELRSVVMSAKHGRRVDLENFLEAAGENLGAAVADSGVVGESGSEIWVVPAPSSWKRRWGGYVATRPLARGVARGIARQTRRRVRLVDAVALRWGRKSQSGRGGAERRRGRVGSMVARVEIPQGFPVIVVDDVVTTGATIREIDRVTGGNACAVVAVSQA